MRQIMFKKHNIKSIGTLKLVHGLAVPVGPVGRPVAFSEVFTKVKVPNLLTGLLPSKEPFVSFVRR